MTRLLPLLVALLDALPLPAAEAPRVAERFADWELVCRAECRIATSVEGAEGTVVLRLVLGGPPEARALRVETPLPLFLPDGLALTLGDGERTAPWRTCGPDGCEARLPADAPLLEGLRRERETGVVLTLLEGMRVRLAASLMGFSAAERAMAARD